LKGVQTVKVRAFRGVEPRVRPQVLPNSLAKYAVPVKIHSSRKVAVQLFGLLSSSPKMLRSKLC